MAGNERTVHPPDQCRQDLSDQNGGPRKPAPTSISTSVSRSSSPSSVRAVAARPPFSRWSRGSQPYTSGTITVGGKRVDRPQTDVGIVFQEAIMLDWRDVLENVMLQIDIRKMDRAKYEPVARALLKATGLAGFENKKPYELSGGMRQRVSICRALVHDPTLLMMDEPFGALDALTREQISMDIQHLWMDKRKTAIHITHTIPEAVLLADRVVVMGPRPGRIVEIIDIDLPRPRRLDKLPEAFTNIDADPQYLQVEGRAGDGSARYA